MTRVTPPVSAPAPAGMTVATRPRCVLRAWWHLYRHDLRLVRNASIAWIATLTLISAGVVATFEHRFPSEAELAAVAELENLPIFEALAGRYVEAHTPEGLALSRWGMFGILVAVWAMLAAVKLLRGQEEEGTVEPLRAGVVSPRGLAAAALAALFSVYLIFALAIGVTHVAVGMDAATAWALGGAVALLAATFAAAGALASQLAGSRRRAVGVVAGFLGFSIGVRVLAAASAAPDWLWWATPFGWMGFLHEVDQARPAVFGAFVPLVAVLAIAAVALAHRDLHQGLWGREASSPRRAPPVRSHTGLALRLTAGSTITWAPLLGGVALLFGLLARDFADAAAELPGMVAVFAQLGWVGMDTPEGVVGVAFYLFIALLLVVFAAGQAAAIREEEATWRLEHLLVRQVGRVRWLLTRSVLAVAAVLLLAAVAGVAAWFGTAITGAPIAFVDGLLSGVNVIPIALLFFGIGIATMGLAPRITAPVTYALAVAAFLLDFVGGMLDLPEAILDVSPFRHITAVPAADLAVGPAAVMIAFGLLAGAIGIVAFRRRDLQEA